MVVDTASPRFCRALLSAALGAGAATVASNDLVRDAAACTSITDSAGTALVGWCDASTGSWNGVLGSTHRPDPS